jgi:phosphoglycerate dehydrogenase-like enzyme
MTHALLWFNEAATYKQALIRSGFADRVTIHTLSLEQQPTAEQLAQTEILVAWSAPPGVLANMPKLRWIQALTAGVENWMANPELRQKVALTCARGSHRVAMPENILGALFHLTKPYAQAAIDQKESRWTRKVSEPLAGKTLGILGIGEIGKELARKAHALELRVIGTKREPAPVPGVDKVYPPEATNDVLEQSDFVLLLLPLTEHTENFMNAQRLNAMRTSAYLLNFGRGGLIVDDDLVQAVKNKVIAGAVLDVFRKEPLPTDHAFWTTPGITVLPHIGGHQEGRHEVVAAIFAANLGQFLAGKTMQTLVDRARGY